MHTMPTGESDSCTEKPLNTLWKNYTSNSKPDVQMKLIVTQSGLKAITKEHGLTEYWSHRITYCCAPSEFSKIFCWVYRHEGRKLKQELRCHAVLCAKESIARQIACQLQSRLTQALIEFKRDKISRQNARLSLANSVYDNPSLPRRKILLSTGCHNYRPPLERSKSAPKLMAIEESLEEEDEILDCKKVAMKTKFATYRNLSYSNRGNRMGGLYCAKKLQSCRKDDDVEDDDESSQCEINDDDVAGDIVEQNPCGCEQDCDLVDVFEKDLTLNEPSAKDPKVTDINENLCPKLKSKRFYRNSWAGDEQPCTIPIQTINVDLDDLPKFQDLIECKNRAKKFFEDDKKPLPSEGSPRTKNLVKHRRKLFENLDKPENSNGDADSALQFDFSEENRDSFDGTGSLDEESTPSLQSISSGSDTSSPRDIKIEYSKNYDLDSLWEEGSDESGFVEPIGQDANDDKIRDLPHHHLMKSCILTSKSRCVEV
ncbi:uncharacterized protein LOC135838706 isoform X2 [Planococcus citri]|uniref:uncharacterized protein LOC135838706 isoform X2 n=1 Tax=Planococcus citri TaxID=170843 RepID=UPI0031F9E149